MTAVAVDDSPRVLLAVDGNSLVHRSFHALGDSPTRTADGAPTWAVRGLFSQLGLLVDRVCADGLVVGFDDPTHNLRKHDHPGYKGTRAEKDPDLVSQLALAVDVLREAGVHVVVPPGLEADDVVAAAAAQAPAAGWCTVIATSDRDAYALVDRHTRLLRLIRGGVDASPLLTRSLMHTLTGVWPEQYRELAALRGDASDNLEGVRGIGPKTGARLLAELGSVDAALADPERTRAVLGDRVAATLASPEAREVYARTVALMTPRPVDLGCDLAGGGAELPLAEDALRAALARVRLDATCRPAIRALCGLEFTPPPPVVATERVRRAPLANPPKAVAKEPELTLF
ncbi:hypothetical protein GCM10027047_06000 [Rhodococcus aerolatus]